VKVEALQAEQAVLEIEGACPRVLPGRLLELSDTENGLDGEYLVTSVVHELSRLERLSVAGGALGQAPARSSEASREAPGGGVYRMVPR